MKLVVVCIECHATTRVSYAGERFSAPGLFQESGGWILTCVDPAAPPAGPVIGPLCPECAAEAYPPEALEAARQAMTSRKPA